MKGFTKPASGPAEEEQKTAELLLKYPSLENMFDADQLRNLPKTKRNMEQTISELERSVRRGTKEEAEKAARVIEACKTTLNFLRELEEIREN